MYTSLSDHNLQFKNVPCIFAIFSVNLNFLFHLISREKDDQVKSRSLQMALFTLEMMDQGGIHDHVSKGFARYSTDQVEKPFMLFVRL
jgi:uncharacterized protein YyaL (SSP411 family)